MHTVIRKTESCITTQVAPTTAAMLERGADAVLTDYMVNLASESAAWNKLGWAGYFFITGVRTFECVFHNFT